MAHEMSVQTSVSGYNRLIFSISFLFSSVYVTTVSQPASFCSAKCHLTFSREAVEFLSFNFFFFLEVNNINLQQIDLL